MSMNARSRAWHRCACHGCVLLALEFATAAGAQGGPEPRHPAVDEASPTTRLHDATIPTLRRSAGARSTFAPAAVPRSGFDLADVPNGRLAEARRLLDALEARPRRGGAISIDLPADILFDFDSDALRADARQVLDRVVTLLDAFPARVVAVNGHTDSRGDDDYNTGLSLRRAERVQRHLAARIEAEGRVVQAHGFGERQPLAPNAHPDGSDDPLGRQRNRRVEIVMRAPAS
jgi:outer membrane protein OmpA-like peptidoglycan-associated protein